MQLRSTPRTHLGAIAQEESTPLAREGSGCDSPSLHPFRGHRSTAGPQSSKLMMRVRLPLSAPHRADSLTRIAVCKTAREGLIPSRLSGRTPRPPSLNGRAAGF